MFDIKTWVEGLFRPVFRVEPTGSTYVATEPDIYSMRTFQRYHRRYRTRVTANAASFTGTVTCPQGSYWILLNAAFVIDGVFTPYNKLYITDQGGNRVMMVSGFYEGAAGGTDHSISLMNGIAPTFVESGESVNIMNLIAAAGNKTIVYTFDVLEIPKGDY